MIGKTKATGIDETATRLATQDNRMTEHPVFAVQEKHRIYGVDPEYVSCGNHAGWGLAWLNEEGDEADEQQTRWLDNLQKQTDPNGEPQLGVWIEEGYGSEDDWTLVGYVEVWEFVTPCFTEAAALRYIEQNRHNLNDPRIYVYSAVGNREWIEAREFIAKQAQAVDGTWAAWTPPLDAERDFEAEGPRL
jgi:hypothetical protein